MTKIKKPVIINLLVSIASIFFVLFCAEIIMRFAWEMGGWVQRPIYRRSPDPYIRYELVPNAKTASISINSDGFRGPEYSVSKPPGTFRILMLGDSETFSYMLKQNESLPAQLETLLNRTSKQIHYEVLNFGVEGYNTFQEMEMLKTKGLKYNPDLIILNYVLNDAGPGEYYFDTTFLMRHSALARYFSFAIRKSLIKRERKRLNIKTETDEFYYYHQPKYFSFIKKTVLEMAAIAKERGNKLVVMIFPCSSIMVKDFRENYPYGKLHETVKSIDPGNIIFVDLIDEFNRLNMTPEGVSINYKYDESHKNAASLNVSARYIYEILKVNNLIPG